VSSGLLLMYGIGATVGPFVASSLMAGDNTGRLFAFSAFVHFALIVFVTIRFLRDSSTAKHQIAFGDALSSAQTTSQVFEEEILQHGELDDVPK
jgi:hypothetical protein